MSDIRKQQICALLKGIETGDSESVKVVNEAQYIQHNPQTHEGSEGLASLFKRLSKTNPKVNIARIFADGDYVFGHTEYDFAHSNIGFEVFRFEHDQVVEHWDNIQRRQAINPAGHSMVDGSNNIEDLDKTEINRQRIKQFMNSVLIAKDLSQLEEYVDHNLIDHSPAHQDGIVALNSRLQQQFTHQQLDYQKMHRVLAEGNFVLSVCEGMHEQQHTSFYDLFRLSNGKIVEHWDTTEVVPDLNLWKNNNGKF